MQATYWPRTVLGSPSYWSPALPLASCCRGSQLSISRTAQAGGRRGHDEFFCQSDARLWHSADGWSLYFKSFSEEALFLAAHDTRVVQHDHRDSNSAALRDLVRRIYTGEADDHDSARAGNGSARETPNKVDGGGGLATEAYLLTAACLEAVWVGGNRGC